MAKRNELRSLLGGLNSRNARSRKHIAFGDLISCDQSKRFPLEPNLSPCDGCSFNERFRRNINHLRPTIGAEVSESFHFPCCHSERSEESLIIVLCKCERTNQRCLKVWPNASHFVAALRSTRHENDGVIADSSAYRNHFAIGLVIISEIMFPRLSVDHIEKNLLELFITRAGPQWSHDVKLQIAAKTWAQLSITREPQLVAVLAEMHVRHCTDETYALCASRNLVVSGRTIRSKLRLRNQASVSRLDQPFRFPHRHEITLVKHFRGADRHQFDKPKQKVSPCGEFD